MELKEFLKPSWIKILFFIILIIPLAIIIYPALNIISLILTFVIIGLTGDSFLSLSAYYILILSPLILIIHLVTVYLASCIAEKTYKKNKNKKALYISIIIGAIFIIGLGMFIYPFLTPYKIIKDSPAPGCVIHEGIAWGGCYGKTIIKDIKIEPEIPCLNIEIDNCNGGVLSIYNKCKQDLKIGDLNLPYNRVLYYEETGYIKLTKNEDGTTIINDFRTLGVKEFNNLRNKKYDLISATGKIGEEEFKITIIDSKELKVTPISDCITFDMAGLNWVDDAIHIINNCEEEVTINGQIIKPYIKEVVKPGGNYTIEIIKDESDNMVVVENNSNFAAYNPTKNETLTTTGIIDKQEFTISYIKTEKLCE